MWVGACILHHLVPANASSHRANTSPMCANRRATHIRRVIVANPSSLLVKKITGVAKPPLPRPARPSPFFTVLFLDANWGWPRRRQLVRNSFCFWPQHGLVSCAGGLRFLRFASSRATKIYGDLAKIYGASPQFLATVSGLSFAHKTQRAKSENEFSELVI